MRDCKISDMWTIKSVNVDCEISECGLENQ